MGKIEKNGIEIDEKRVMAMFKRIIREENKNILSNDPNDSKMIDIIKNIIEEEEKKCN